MISQSDVQQISYLMDLHAAPSSDVKVTETDWNNTGGEVIILTHSAQCGYIYGYSSIHRYPALQYLHQYDHYLSVPTSIYFR